MPEPTDDRFAVLTQMLKRYPDFRAKHSGGRLADWAETYLEDMGGVPAELLAMGIKRVRARPWEWNWPPPADVVLAECVAICSEIRVQARQLCEEAQRDRLSEPQHSAGKMRHSLALFDQLRSLPRGLYRSEEASCTEMRSILALPPPTLVPLALPVLGARSGARHGERLGDVVGTLIEKVEQEAL